MKNILQDLKDKWNKWQEKRLLGKMIVQKEKNAFFPQADAQELNSKPEPDVIETKSEENEMLSNEEDESKQNSESESEDT